ncbi:MAG: tetratricopeptide repeat protein, partial [Xanthomonadales bacterium]|nr:tetratricopeptide repeat protein [Xanthomonadales bacterium]
VEALEATLGTGSPPLTDAQVRITDNVAAYEAYLRGQYQVHNRGQLGANGLLNAMASFQEAIDADPEFAEAWAGLGMAHTLYPGYAGTATEGSAPEAEAALLKAVELDPEMGEPHAALGMLRSNQSRWVEADRAMAEALRVDPEYETAYIWYGTLLTRNGRSAKARDVLLLAADKDPVSGIAAHWLADIYRNLGDMERSRQESIRSIELGVPSSSMGAYIYHLRREEWDQAREYLEVFNDAFYADPAWVDLLLEAVQDPTAIPAFHARIDEIRADQPSFFYGWMYFDLADTDLLIDVIEEHAERGRLGDLIWRVWEPDLTELRNHPRFKALMEEQGLIDYWRETGWPDLCQQSTDELVCE